VTYEGDGRSDTFDVEVTEGNTELDRIRFMEPITGGQAELGTGIVNLNYLGDEDTRPEAVRLRAASQRAELNVEEISLIGDRLSAVGSVTSRAEGIVRLRYSYVDPDGQSRSISREPPFRTTVTESWTTTRCPPSSRAVGATCRSSSPASSSGASAASNWPTSSTLGRRDGPDPVGSGPACRPDRNGFVGCSGNRGEGRTPSCSSPATHGPGAPGPSLRATQPL
jgi:hypothetical protein